MLAQTERNSNVDAPSFQAMLSLYLTSNQPQRIWATNKGTNARIALILRVKVSQLWAIINNIPSPTNNAPRTPKITKSLLTPFSFS